MTSAERLHWMISYLLEERGSTATDMPDAESALFSLWRALVNVRRPLPAPAHMGRVPGPAALQPISAVGALIKRPVCGANNRLRRQPIQPGITDRNAVVHRGRVKFASGKSHSCRMPDGCEPSLQMKTLKRGRGKRIATGRTGPRNDKTGTFPP